MPHPNAALIESLYAAMNAKDGDAMAALYAPDATFEDPAFGELDGRQAGDMWRMLTSRATDLRVEVSEVEADDTSGSAHWVAHYTFGATGRKVVNDIRATYRFRDGLIVEHRDRFDHARWARQALGPVGVLLGWLPPFRAQLRKKARAQLDAYRAG